MAGDDPESSADGGRWGQMVGHGTKFGRKKEAAIAALLSQRTIDDAARAVNIGANTLLRWLKDPTFAAEYRSARRAAYGQAIARLQHGAAAAAAILLKLMYDSATPASTRMRAAESVLDRAHKAIELEDLDARLTELERAARDAVNRRKR